MNGICAHNVSSELADHQQGRFARFPSHYSLTVGKEYVILGMSVFEAVLNVLVRDDWKKPLFCPAALFEIKEQPFPSNWYFTLEGGIRLSGNEAWGHSVAKWGYKELVSNNSHIGDLEEEVREALVIFEKEYLKAGGKPDGPEPYTGPWPGWPDS